MAAMQVSPGPACAVVGLAIAIWGVIANWRENGVTRLAFAELPWVGDRRAPFLIASSIFGSQSFVSLSLMYILKNMRELAESWGSRFQSTLRFYSVISLVGAGMYIVKYWSASHLIVHMDGVGEYLFSRSLHWLVSTSAQWFVFSQVCTKATEEEMQPIYLHTFLTQVFGILMYFEREASQQAFCFLAASACFVESFRLGFRLKLHKDMQVTGCRLRWTMLLVWTCFPIVLVLRLLNYIDPWVEQVLLLSILDVVAKSVTFSAIIVSRVVLSLARINGTVQLVLSSHDVTIAVDDAWQLLDDSASNSIISTYFGESATDSARLIDLCINKEHQNRLIEAARKADSQHLGAPTPKVVVAFRLPGGGGGEMLAECLISKCLHGRRIIGIAVASQAGNMNFASQSVPDSLSDDFFDHRAPSETSASTTATRTEHVQMKLALHNCNDVLQLGEPFRRMVNALFKQTHTACALFAWEESITTPAVVVASPRLQALFFQASQMPQPLTTLVSSSMVDRFLLALQDEDVILHQWRDVESVGVGQMSFEVTILPLTRMSMLGDHGCGVQLCVLVLVLADSSERRPRAPGYLRWLPAGCQLACDEGEEDKARSDEPPSIVTPLVSAYLERLR